MSWPPVYTLWGGARAPCVDPYREGLPYIRPDGEVPTFKSSAGKRPTVEYPPMGRGPAVEPPTEEGPLVAPKRGGVCWSWSNREAPGKSKETLSLNLQQLGPNLHFQEHPHRQKFLVDSHSSSSSNSLSFCSESLPLLSVAPLMQ